MKLFTKPWSFSVTLHILLVVMVVFPIVTISTMILQVYKRDLLQQTTERTLQTLHAVTYSAQQEIGKIEYAAAAVGVDRDVLSTVTSLIQADESNRFKYINDLTLALSRYTYSMSSQLLAIHFFYKDGGVYSFKQNLIKDEQELRSASWYQNLLQHKDSVQFLSLQETLLYGVREPLAVTAVIAPSDYHTLSNVEMIYFSLNEEAFDKILRQQPNDDSTYVIVSKEGQVVTASYNWEQSSLTPAKLEQIRSAREGHFIDQVSDRKMMVTYASVGETGWKAIQEIPYSKVTANYERIFKFVLFATIAVIIVFLLISFYLVHSLTRPIHVLVRKMSLVMEGELNAKIGTSKIAEMAALGRTFNHMLDQMKLLLRQREEQEQAKRKAEFAALQSQINPHFLINTLNAIKLMALISKADNIRNMTNALMRLVSSAFNRGGVLIRFSDEIANLKHYLYIMEIRYGNKFEVEWHIDPQAESKYLLKLLLQPILENSIVHGMAGKETRGKIVIQARIHEGSLHIVISDNGEGMTEEQLEEFRTRRSPHTFTGMGVANVHHRIQLHHGEDYGIILTANDPRGTRVAMKIPIIHRDQEEEQPLRLEA
ncbi:histidine kinase [Paenibacillus qinlingensis]|uniref:histidine kinase n=1 Tax=Paenibacillus qinlingensis TaxID=1837343 RepID=A0ABU1NUI0_9BACL|nr:histidine kinase [Paenibacillus qinlingensis]MDR6550652.1 two-component system sensor histidine kinase YesM [Paenibacillus qinlingensis]